MPELVTRKEQGRRLMVLIVCIIICTFSLVGGIYAIKGANDAIEKEQAVDTIRKLKGEIEELRRETRTIEDNYVEFSRAIGWRTATRASYERHPATGVSGRELKAYLDYWVKELARPGYDVKDFRPWLQEGSGEQLFLTKLYDKLGQLEAEYRSKNEQLKTTILSAEESARKTLKEIDETEQRNLEEIDKQLKEDYKRLLKDLATRERQHADEEVALDTESYGRQRELTDLKNRDLQEQSRQEARLEDLVSRINWIQFRREEAKERKDPDGAVLAVDARDQIVYIDLLHRDRIWTGSRFRVYTLEKGGVKTDKGEIEVVQVRADVSSRAAIVKTFDAEDPIRPGDRIYNEFYEKGKTRYIAIAGRLTGKLSNEEAERKIRDFGDVYQARVDERTNYVVVAEGYEQHVNFALSEEWGVKLLLERHLYDYLGVP